MYWRVYGPQGITFKRGISALLKKQKKDVVDPSAIQRVQNQPQQVYHKRPKALHYKL